MAPLANERQFYLASGTAVALQIGHRRSVDLDWFTRERLADPLLLARELQEGQVPFEVSRIDPGTLHGTVARVRVSFLEYRYPLLEPVITSSELGCSLASLDDLACMKLAAIAQRGAKRDFVDLYALGSRHRPLNDLLPRYQRKYSTGDLTHVLYRLASTDDADRERTPAMLWDVDWRTMKRTIQQWVREITA